MNITGNYTQASGSSYTAEVNTTSSDLINITGTATIQSGAAVNVQAAAGSYTLGHRYTILTAAGGVSGTYDSLTDNTPFVDFLLAYDLNNVYLDVILSTTPLLQVAQTPNQIGAAAGLMSLGTGNPIFDAAVMLDASQARQAYDLLSGEIHPSVLTMLLEQSRFIRDSVVGRMRQFVGGPASLFAPQIATRTLGGDDVLAYANGKRDQGISAIDRALAAADRRPTFTAWAQTYGNWGHSKSDGNAAALNRAVGGFFTGIDETHAGPEGALWRFGLAGGYQRMSLDVNDRISSAGIDTYDLAAYGATQQGPLGLRLGSAYEWHDISTSRTIAFPGFSDAAHARYRARTAQVFGEAGYSITWEGLSFEPFAGLAYVNVRANDFTEGGGAATLTVTSGRADSTFSTVGLRAAMPLTWTGIDNLTAKSSMGWRHAFGTIVPTDQLAFASGGTPLITAGLPVSKNAAAVEFSIDGRLSRDADLSVAYVGQLARSTQDHGIKGEYTQRF
jgi:outer membrane autotransporter protein